MNKQKLKLLIKFDQIKVLEDFFNQYSESEQQIHLDVEVSDDHLLEIAELVHNRSARKRSK